MASPAFGAIGTKANINNTGSVSRPSVSAGDLMVMFVVLDFANATFTPPSGWTLGDAYDNSGAFNSEFRYYWKIAGSSESASYSVTVSGQPGGNNYGGVVIATWTGADQTTPINAYAQAQSGSGTTTVPCPSVTTTVADTTLVCFYGDRSSFSSITYTQPSGMTERYDEKLGSEPAGIADKAVAAIGATGVQNATGSSAQGYVAFSFAIAPAAASGVDGAASWTEENDTAAGSGSLEVTGTSTTTESDDTAAGSGTVGDVVTGTIATTEADDAAAASGTLTVSGSSATTEANDAASASGTAGTAFVTEPIMNNTETILANQAVVWSWLPAGRIGALDTVTAVDGTGTTASDGTLTVTGLSAGAGILMVAVQVTDATDDYVYYEAGTVA